MNNNQSLQEKLKNSLSKVFIGDESTIKSIIACYLAGGHVLLEGPPGTGKTLLAKAISRLFSKEYKRIQCTTDILPSDILGAQFYDPKSQKFEMIKGPIFTSILLVDEINRAPARTQSALLEAMAEKQVTIEGKTFELDKNFFLIATQNPQDYEGTFALPEVQLDRFMMRIKLTHSTPKAEAEILKQFFSGSISNEYSKLNNDPIDVNSLKENLNQIHIDKSLIEYSCHILDAFRSHPSVAFGPSIRASQHLLMASRALAFFEQRDHIIPDDIKTLAPQVLNHRLQMSSEFEIAQNDIHQFIKEIVDNIRVKN